MSIKGRLSQLAGHGPGYIFFGSLAALVDIGAFALLVSSGLPILPAATISFLVGSVCNYLMLSRFVFKNPPSVRRFLRYLFGASGGLVINVGLTWTASSILQLAPLVAKILGTGVAFAFNFIVNACVVFRPPLATEKEHVS